ncbi:heavy-metal-associated domain-containing protein [uncultured Sphingomonas sp.]|uniref:heavy-metal-associated domain-containing protein n=1 Tax=uncultured Sphingomonas sp. TaxID=158754 RepID=UPI0035CC2BD9
MRRPPLLHSLAAAIALGLLVASGMVAAQSAADNSAAPEDSSGSFEVSGVTVDVAGPNANAARLAGWRVAQRKGWQMLSQRLGGGGGALPDGTLDSIVSGIVVENEQIGPNRYIARLGVLFNRARAGSILGVATTIDRSPPMLVIPIERSAGVDTGFEGKSDWLAAWLRYRTAESQIDYVRPTATGPDSLLLNAGQVQRRDRGWWRTVLDQYAASDIVIPLVALYRQWPGGPVIGVFEARHGPDNDLIGRFALRVESEEGVPALLDAGVRRMDDLYQNALRAGVLRIDPSLAYIPPVAATPTPTPTPTDASSDFDLGDPGLVTGAGAGPVSIQFDTPNAGAVTAAEGMVRGIPGVAQATTTSLALGGVSVMRVTFAGDPDALRAALEARGYAVARSGSILRIRRAPSLPPPSVPADNMTAG